MKLDGNLTKHRFLQVEMLQEQREKEGWRGVRVEDVEMNKNLLLIVVLKMKIAYDMPY